MRYTKSTKHSSIILKREDGLIGIWHLGLRDWYRNPWTDSTIAAYKQLTLDRNMLTALEGGIDRAKVA